MKPLIKSAICLSIFAFTVCIIQISCSKTDAQTNSNNNQNALTQINKILYTSFAAGTTKIWIANYDGSAATQINIALPAGVSIPFGSSDLSMHLSPDGLKLFFFANNPVSPGANSLYSCDINGTNVQPVVTSSTELLHLYGAY